MGYNENIEKLFQEDIRDKRRTGSGQFHRRGKGVKHGISGALRTSYYFMSAKERKQLNSEVRAFNMYDKILKRDEFYANDKETQKKLLIHWRDNFSNQEITKEMGVGINTLSKLIKELELPPKPRGGARKGTGERKARTKAKTPQINNTTLETISENPPVPQVTPILITKGFNLEYNGEFDAEHISKIFTKLQLVIEGEENKFNVSISITEIT